ncbi:MAG: nucleotidyltransferase [Elusimicrobia bacterium RIFOXYA1_FULL_47_7]|nr:MAG: nucleotidyltransferase [Elusimicrobia bacterium RIFOXYA12_FULL_49_49]OGS09694.1 MAG: nucleotidyltransferase [Elusimicrobia bacterium RIFOXYA1_FULL_47_7]OGS16793.1 MAG: nucleotidyltransferase [Elusimicrobia bacterium RIFOXYA2_FULL_47_53]OGS32021.1 MAG: nucleotidyltransferase [Elusimicrobia bacterium RIFOXYB2_FULL_46_23]
MDKLNKILISPKQSIRHALKQIDSAGEKILFVVDSDNTLLGAVTDGDIRRWILKGGKLGKPISSAMRTKPITLSEGYAKSEARDLMVRKSIECIPIINSDSKIVSAIWWVDLFQERTKLNKKLNLPVVLMAGGEGTRLSPLTKVLPKPLMLIGDKPIIERIMEKFSDYGSKDFYLSVNYKSSIIKAYFHDVNLPYNIHYIEEHKPLGTAGSLHLLKGSIKKTFCVSNCDILIEADLADILEYHKKSKSKITLVGSMKHYTIPYGVCGVGPNGMLSKIDEKPEYDFLVNTGMYILEPEVIKLIPKDKPYHMTDLINKLMANGETVGIYPISEKSWLDMGQFEELKDMLKRYGVQ